METRAFLPGKNLVSLILRIVILILLSETISIFIPEAGFGYKVISHSSAIVLALLLQHPVSSWGLISIVAGLTFMLSGIAKETGVQMTVLHVFTSLAESLLAARILLSVAPPKVSFTRIGDVIGLVLVAAGLNAGTSFCAALFIGQNTVVPFYELWTLRWVSNMLGLLALTPFLVSWSSFLPTVFRQRIHEVIKGGGLFLLWCSVVWLVFTTSYSVFNVAVDNYFLVPLLIILTFSRGVPFISACLISLAAISVFSVVHGLVHIPFAFTAEGERLFSLQIYLSLTCITVLLFSAAQNERLQANTALKAKTSQLRRFFSSSPGLLCVADTDGYFRMLSAEWQRTLGYDLSEMEGRLFLDFVHPDDLEATREKIKQLERQEVVLDFENRYRCKDGSYRSIEWQCYPEGQTLFAIARDATGRKEAELIRLRNQRMESLGVLAGGVAHDFNNLLSVILGHVRLLERYLKPTSPKVIERIEAIQRACKRGTSTIRQLLTYARKSESFPEKVQVNDLLKDIATALHETFPPDIEIETSFAADLPLVRADAGLLHQALLNLCLNGRDAMPKGGKLTLRSSKTGADGKDRSTRDELVVIEVIDNGEGIDEVHKPFVFDPFFTTKKAGLGTGLGLALVQSEIEQLNGSISFESHKGQGSTFRVQLPSAGYRQEGESDSERSDNKPKRQTILVVEDEELLLEMLDSALQDEGYSVIKCNDGLRAIELYKNNIPKIDLVVLDLHLGGLDGEEVFREFRKLSPTLKVIVASAYIEPKVKESLQALSPLRLMDKPYDPNELLAEIDNAFA